MDAITCTLGMAVGTVLLAQPAVAIYVLRVSPTAKQRRLENAGLRGPRPSFPLGNIEEMRRKEDGADPAGSSSKISHDIHPTAFPYFSRWRESYGAYMHI